MAALISSVRETASESAVRLFHSYLLGSLAVPHHFLLLHLPQDGWLAHLLTDNPWLHQTLAILFIELSVCRLLSERCLLWLLVLTLLCASFHHSHYPSWLRYYKSDLSVKAIGFVAALGQATNYYGICLLNCQSIKPMAAHILKALGISQALINLLHYLTSASRPTGHIVIKWNITEWEMFQV